MSTRDKTIEAIIRDETIEAIIRAGIARSRRDVAIRLMGMAPNYLSDRSRKSGISTDAWLTLARNLRAAGYSEWADEVMSDLV
jgi:hypothetical protein